MSADLCDFCSGHLKRESVDYQIKREAEWIVIRNVQVDKCQQCGELYLDSETSEAIDLIYNARKKLKPVRYIPVPVFLFSKAKTSKEILL